MTRTNIAVAVGLGVIAIWALLAWLDPARRIDRRLDGLEKLMSKGGREEQITAWGTARQVSALFSPGFTVLARPYEGQLTDERQLTAAVHRYRTAADEITAVIDERKIEVRENRTALSSFRATVTMDPGTGPGRDSFRILATWQEDDGEWLINRLELVEVLEGRDARWW